MITIEAMGLTEAQGVTDFMLTALGEYSGCFYRGTTREPDEDGIVKTNAEVVQELKDHPKNRDLKTFNDADAARFGAVWREAIVEATNDFQAQNGGGLKKVYQKMPVEQLAKTAANRAWRKAGQAVLARMKDRLDKQLSAYNTGSESPAALVSPGYARWRQEKYGIPEGVVYKATGQLTEDLSPDVPGRISLVKGVAAVGRAEAAANIQSAVSALKSATGL